MNAVIVEARIRRLLLGLVMFMSVGTVAELWLAEHTKETTQLIPFALCALTFLTALAVLLRPNKGTVWTFRAICVGTLLGSALGMYYHLSGNYEFVAEMRPNMAATDVLIKALEGAAPLLAPGLMGTMALFGLVATYFHPALGARKNAE
jgi:hypothetical protein